MKKIMVRNAVVLLALTFVIVTVVVSVPRFIKQKPIAKAPPHVSFPCSTAADPCIKIIEQDGTVFKLNDFRFVDTHCVLFVSLPDGVHHEACGNYRLDWIGPQPKQSQEL